jgi:hypothetical protein
MEMVRPIDVVVDPSFDNTTLNDLPSITLMKILVIRKLHPISTCFVLHHGPPMKEQDHGVPCPLFDGRHGMKDTVIVTGGVPFVSFDNLQLMIVKCQQSAARKFVTAIESHIDSPLIPIPMEGHPRSCSSLIHANEDSDSHRSILLLMLHLDPIGSALSKDDPWHLCQLS